MPTYTSPLQQMGFYPIVIGMLASVVRNVRSQVLSMKEMAYVLAARALGAPVTHIMGRHIMPTVWPST